MATLIDTLKIYLSFVNGTDYAAIVDGVTGQSPAPAVPTASADHQYPRGSNVYWEFTPTNYGAFYDIDQTGASKWVINAADTTALNNALGSRPGDANWNGNADLDNNNVVDARDSLLLNSYMGGVVTGGWDRYKLGTLVVSTLASGHTTPVAVVGDRIQDGNVIGVQPVNGSLVGSITDWGLYVDTPIRVGSVVSGNYYDFIFTNAYSESIPAGVHGYWPILTGILRGYTAPPQRIIGSWPEFLLTVATTTTERGRVVGSYTYQLFIRDIGWVAFLAGVQNGMYSCDVLNYLAQHAITNYDNYRFTSLVEYKGHLYGANANGLFDLEYIADEDEAIDGTGVANAPINAYFITKQTELDRTQFKNLLYVYLSMQTNGLTYAEVREQGNNLYWPQSMTSTNNIWMVRKVTFSRGNRNAYWSIKVGNTAGADFHVENMELIIDEHLRKVTA